MGKLKKLNKLNGKGIISYTPNDFAAGEVCFSNQGKKSI